MMVLGDAGVGKTCLLVRYISNSFAGDYAPTEFDTFTANLTVNNVSATIELSDMPGNGDSVDSSRVEKYADINAFILAFSIVDFASFENIRTKWYPEIIQHSPGALVVLAGTKTDLRNDEATSEALLQEHGRRPLTRLDGSDMCRDLGAFNYWDTSSVNGEGIEEMFVEIVKAMRIRAQGGANPPRPPRGQKLSKCTLI